MAALAEHKIKIRYEGGLADENALPGYDGAVSIDGITRAVHIALHAYMTGEVTSRATALKRASIQIRPARQGSFVFELVLLIEAYPATSGLVGAIGAPMIYDFLKTAFKRATGGLDAEPENRILQNLYHRQEPPPLKVPPVDLDELAEILEGCLQDAHRPIGPDGIETISIGSPRQELVSFNLDTKDWVNTREQSEDLEILRGNVTRYNSMSRNARVYIDEFRRIVPMRPAGDFDVSSLALLSWSLHGSNIGTHNKLDLQVRRVFSASGKVKRLLLSGCERVPV
ncbi:hypothetical protein [Devosia sp. FKR38]|uniref:DUF7946 domain-containing protein n=1 Tax=Devosia sp. FKR38 TaxID=2562312 RepID=UPI0010C1389E|nr:hypothetical protein [Devosia sp. FKR38]